MISLEAIDEGLRAAQRHLDAAALTKLGGDADAVDRLRGDVRWFEVAYRAAWTYCSARRVADLWWTLFEEACAAGADIWAEDWRRRTTNTYHCVSDAGLFVEFYCGCPTSLWTPWGRYIFMGTRGGPMKTWAGLVYAFMKRFDATLAAAGDPRGSRGNIFALRALDGDLLPTPDCDIANGLRWTFFEGTTERAAAWAFLTGAYDES